MSHTIHKQQVRYQAWVDFGGERVRLPRCTPRDVNQKLLSVT